MKRIFVLFVLIVSGLTVYSQSTFKKLYNDIGFGFVPMSDGGFTICGWTNETSSVGEIGLMMMRTDAYGDTLWTRKFGSDVKPDAGSSIIRCLDGGFAIAGESESFGSGFETDVYFLKTDSLGSLLWARIYGGSGYEHARCVRQTSDGGFVLAGMTKSFGAGNEDIYLIRTDANGNIEWTKTFGGPAIDQAYSVEQTPDNGFIVAGHTASFGAGVNDLILIKTDSVGTLLWNKTYGGTDQDYGYALKQLDDGNFVVVGRSASYGPMRGYLLKLSVTGIPQWSMLYNNTYDLTDLVQISDGEYLITGGGTSLLKTDSLGNSMWERKHKFNVWGSTGKQIYEMDDGGIAVLGNHDFGTYPGLMMFVLKTDPSGFVGCSDSSAIPSNTSFSFTVNSPVLSVSSGGFDVLTPTTTEFGHGVDTVLCFGTIGLSEKETKENFIVYPNPFSNSLTIEFRNSQKGSIRVLDILGKEYRSFSFSGQEAAFEKGELKAGIYFLQVLTDRNIIGTKKIIIQ